MSLLDSSPTENRAQDAQWRATKEIRFTIMPTVFILHNMAVMYSNVALPELALTYLIRGHPFHLVIQQADFIMALLMAADRELCKIMVVSWRNRHGVGCLGVWGFDTEVWTLSFDLIAEWTLVSWTLAHATKM